MNLSADKRSPVGGQAGAGVLGGHTNTASAQFSVGAVGFGPAWHDDEPSLREMYDAACATIIRLECEADELRAEVALLREQSRIVAEERDEARAQYQTTHLLAEALAKTQCELKKERDGLSEQIAWHRRNI